MNCAAIKEKLTVIGVEMVSEAEYARKGFALDVQVAPHLLVAAVSVLDAEGFFIEAITGVDWLGEQAALRKEAEAKVAAEAKAQPEAEAAAGEAPPLVSQPAEQGEIPEDALEVVYDFNHYEGLCRVTIRARLPRSKPEIATISSIYPGANWHERETHDFFGIIFVGHPYLVPLLLPEDADFHPLLKDFRS
ncbi:MAG TPA: nitroreductase family protein [Desulfobulbaceae bacterium]|nr:MAG: NADH dehydrogenase [Deltaproteobacteria bacterium RIFOXYD12_FULL_53_23]HCC53747.1 nitroreductase family protein [Desulfobulbaceae bacterium]